MTNFLGRVLGASSLKANIYEEVEHDRTATVQAIVVVVLSALGTGLGARGFGAPLSALPAMVAVALLGWVAWALLTYQIGVTWLSQPQTRSDAGEVMRTLGFASAPGVWRALAVVPELAVAVFVLTTVWMLLTMVMALKQALDYSNSWRAVGVCLVAWTLTAAAMVALSALAPPLL